MTLVLDRPAAAVLLGHSDDDVAAWVLRRRGSVYPWRACGLADNALVTTWQAHALEAGLSYAVLLFNELARLT